VDWISITKSLLELGGLGALLVLTVNLWIKSHKELKDEFDKRVLAEKEHGKELLKIQAEYNRQHMELIRQYDATLTTVNQTMTAMAEDMRD
jgi:hypothetical protein